MVCWDVHKFLLGKSRMKSCSSTLLQMFANKPRELRGSFRHGDWIGSRFAVDRLEYNAEVLARGRNCGGRCRAALGISNLVAIVGRFPVFSGSASSAVILDVVNAPAGARPAVRVGRGVRVLNQVRCLTNSAQARL